MKLDLKHLPELPDEPHWFFLVAERRLELPGGATAGWRTRGQGQPLLVLADLHHGGFACRSLLGRTAARHTVHLVDLFDTGGVRLDGGDGFARLCDRLVELAGREQFRGAPWLACGEAALAALVVAAQGQVGLPALVAMSPPAPPGRLGGWLARWQSRPAAVERRARRMQAAPLAAAAALLDYADPAVPSRQELRWLARRLATLPAARETAERLAAVRQPGFAAPAWELLESRLAAPAPFPCPLRLVTGSRIEPARLLLARKLNQAFTGSELLVVEGSGPQVIAEQPAQVEKLLETLG